jgi:hypothetical protein
MIARVWHGFTTPEHAEAYESHLKPEFLPGLTEKKASAAVISYAERLGTKSNSSPSFCGTRSMTFGRSPHTITRGPSSPKTGYLSCRAMTPGRRTMRSFRPWLNHPHIAARSIRGVERGSSLQ